jgi:hypothetical protein
MIPVIVNAAAGSGHADGDWEELRRLFARGRRRGRVLAARDGARLSELARRAMRQSRR